MEVSSGFHYKRSADILGAVQVLIKDVLTATTSLWGLGLLILSPCPLPASRQETSAPSHTQQLCNWWNVRISVPNTSHMDP